MLCVATTFDNMLPFFITAAAVSSQEDSIPKMYVCIGVNFKKAYLLFVKIKH